MYTTALYYYLLGYANITPLDLLVFLRLTYGHIAPLQLADCYSRIATPYEIQEPIELLFSHIDTGVHYANAGGQPYDEDQYVNIAFLLVLATPPPCMRRMAAPLACGTSVRHLFEQCSYRAPPSVIFFAHKL
jgi:hypothetical protein